MANGIDHILVTPEELSAQSEAVRGHLNLMKENFSSLQNLIAGTSGYWEGSAGDNHRQMYEQNMAVIEEMIARYQEHITDLGTMAGVYTETEKTAQSVAEQLPSSDL